MSKNYPTCSQGTAFSNECAAETDHTDIDEMDKFMVKYLGQYSHEKNEKH